MSNYLAVPAEMRDLTQWVCWKLECRQDKGTLTKVPYAVNGKHAQSTNPATWTTFQNAVQASDDYSGIGFVFKQDGGVVGIDIDHCRDMSTTEITNPLAAEMVRDFHSYTEISPSRTGLHIFCKGKLPGRGHKWTDAGVEMYDGGRFFTITGNSLSSAPFPLVDAQGAINKWYNKFASEHESTAEKPTEKRSISLDDSKLLETAANANDGTVFHDLFMGNWQDHSKSQSEADLALCNLLAFWTGKDAAQMDRLFRESGLYRKKWNELHGKQTYGAMTIQKAINGCHDVYGERPTAKQDFTGVSFKSKDAFGRSEPQKKKAALSIVPAYKLQNAEIPPLTFIVDGILPQGLALLCSPPKYGKSWLVLALCLSVAAGEQFLNHNTMQSKCLYLALEDSARRLQDRMNKILASEPVSRNFDFALHAPTLGGGLIEALENYINENPTVRLIVIDTLQKIRDPATGRENAYSVDYREVGALKKFADKHNICVLLVHHLRKMQDIDDPFMMISGTNGIMGAADTTFVMTREHRADKETKLSYTGRDIEQNEIIMKFDKSEYKWHVEGFAEEIEEKKENEEYDQNPTVNTIKKLLEQCPNGWEGTTKELMDAGLHFENIYLASTTEKLSREIKKLTPVLWNVDRIVHESVRNGSGGKKHRFYYSNIKFSTVGGKPATVDA